MTTTNSVTGTMRLDDLAATAAAEGDWWNQDNPPESDLALPPRVIDALSRNGIETVEQLKAAGPVKLREMEHIGKQAFDQIVAMLRAFEKKNGNGG